MENLYWATLTSVKGIGSSKIRKLKNHFGSVKNIWEAKFSDLKESKIISIDIIEELCKIRDSNYIDQLSNNLEKYQIKICIQDDEFYPQKLNEIDNPPFLLYYQGRLQKKEECIGIVGSRNATAYGKQVARWLGEELTNHNFTIVSGAAKGIDSEAHCGALKTGRTFAVVGTGLDIIYPSSNIKLMNEIIEKDGAIISQFPLGTKPLAGNFPARNKLISGLSKGIIVVEAANKSGSLITAEFALSQGKDVFAIPGNIYSKNSVGCHKLIQEGAKLVFSIDDIIEEYEINCIKEDNIKMEKSKLDNPISLDYGNLSDDEKKICELLNCSNPISADEIIYKLRGEVSNIAFILLQLKLQGILTEEPINHYCLKI